MKKLIAILIAILATQFALGQAKKPAPTPTPKPTTTTSTTNTTQNKYPDFTLTQETEFGDGEMKMSGTTMSKGVRDRKQIKIGLPPGMGGAEAAMMQQMMGGMAQPIELRQCDLKQTVLINESKKTFFIDYDDESSIPADKLKNRPKRKPMIVKGTATIDSTIVDSGKRQMMFGYEAKWLTHTQTIETSADSCEGKESMKTVREGWFIRVSLNSDTCPVYIPPGSGGCRPKMIIKGIADPGFFLEGTTKMWDKGKLATTMKIKTLELSKSPLDQALFEVPTKLTEVDSYTEMMQGISGPVDNSATTVIENSVNEDDKTQTKAKGKTIAIDFFSGNASKVNQEELRGYISSKVSAAGMNGFPINSQADLQIGNFVNVIGVELKKIKESSGAKIGGLFGKVTGNSDAAKLGDSEAEIVITIYGKDGKTAVASEYATVKMKGSPNDAVKGAIDKIIGDLLAKIK
jgi:hypothetical protein